MAYDERLAGRVRAVLAGSGPIDERKMFGGLAFMRAGHMVAGVLGCDLMVRIGPDDYEQALSRPHARPMDFTGKPLRGMVYVAPAGTRTEAALARWLELGLAYVGSLPAKKAPGAKRRR